MTEYSSMDELKKNEVEHVDWRQSHQDRHSWLVVVAPHARTIEPLTELIAKEIAGDQYSLFVFEGLRRKDPNRKWLHVRSELYKDNDLEQLQKNAKVSLSVHGAKNSTAQNVPEKVTHVGGNNDELRELIWNALDGCGFAVVLGEEHLAGKDPNNFVNRTQLKGVQLEISRSEREALADNPVRRARYVNAIKEAILAYQASLYSGKKS